MLRGVVWFAMRAVEVDGGRRGSRSIVTHDVSNLRGNKRGADRVPQGRGGFIGRCIKEEA